MNNSLDRLVSKFGKVNLKRTRKSFVGPRRTPSTRRITVAAKMKSKAEARAEIERKEEEVRAIKRAKLKATRKAKAAELKLIEQKETKAQANLNGLMNAFGKMNFSKNRAP